MLNLLKFWVISACAAVMCCVVHPAVAQDYGQDRGPISVPRDSVEGHARDGYEYMIAALEYDKDGKNHDACRNYNYARDEFAAAIYASISQKTVVDLGEIQDEANAAIAGASKTCGKADDEPVHNYAPDLVPQVQREAAAETRRLFREFYLPVVALWAPFIEKPLAEIDVVGLKVDELGQTCENQRSEVEDAKIRSALSAIDLCLAVKYWLSDNPASSCAYLADDPDYVRNNPYDDAEMAKAYDDAGMPAIKARLRKVAACEAKSPADWNSYSIATFNSLPSYAYAVPEAAGTPYYAECIFASKLAVNAKYDAAISAITAKACGSVLSASDNRRYNSADAACEKLGDGKAAFDALLAQRPDAPGTSEAPKIYATFARLQGDLGCASGSPQLHFGGPPVAFKRAALPGES